MSIVYVKPEEIRLIHQIMLERYGGLPGEHEPGMIDFLTEKPSQALWGQELYPGLFLKAAVYMYGFATNQYFISAMEIKELHTHAWLTF